jgi:hypothetical protein
MSIIDLGKSAFPGAPAAGFSRIYADTDGALHVVLDNGTDIQLGISVNNGSGAPIDAKYLVLGLSAGLTNERVFSAGQGIEYSDGGPGGLFTLSIGAHKSQHAAGGSDPLSPSDVGSAAAVHTHDDRYFTEGELANSGAGGHVHWDNLTNKPAAGTGDMVRATYDTDLDGKVESADVADAAPWAGITDKPTTFTPSAHTHAGVYSPTDHTHAGVYSPVAHTHTFGIEAILGNGSETVATGLLGFVVVPFACTISSCQLVADAVGSIVVNIWRGAGTIPVLAGSIVAAAKPTLSSAQLVSDVTLTGWTTSLTAGDILGFNVESASTVKQVTLALRGTRS